MKQLFLIIFLLASVSIFAQQADTTNKTTISIDTVLNQVVYTETVTTTTVKADTTIFDLQYEVDQYYFYKGQRDAAIKRLQARIEKVKNRFNPRMKAHKSNVKFIAKKLKKKWKDYIK